VSKANPKKPIGSGHCYVIAEVGVNHNGDVDLARKLIDVAADAGADAVKFQNFRTEDFIFDRALTWSYETPQGSVTEPQYDMFKRYEFTGEKLAAAAEHCRKRGVDFASTPTSEEGVAECVRLGAAFLKNGSDYLTHLPLIRTMARTGLQTVLSTGMASEDDIAEACAAYREAGGSDLVLLHCVSLYPAAAETLNLRRISALAARFGCPIGFSDHSEGITAAAVAAAFGAVAIERHITLDKAMVGPDHKLSADPDELRTLVRTVREAEAALGDGRLDFGEAEREARAQHRLSCIAARALPAGAMIKAQDIAFRRPGQGLPPKSAERMVGRTLVRGVEPGHVFSEADFR
jgi:N,N'-diacetyllegionaminate synthase